MDPTRRRTRGASGAWNFLGEHGTHKTYNVEYQKHSRFQPEGYQSNPAKTATVFRVREDYGSRQHRHVPAVRSRGALACGRPRVEASARPTDHVAYNPVRRLERCNCTRTGWQKSVSPLPYPQICPVEGRLDQRSIGGKIESVTPYAPNSVSHS